MVKRLSSVDQNDNSLVNVPTPANGGDAVNKSYADTKVQGVNTSKITVSSTEPASPQEGDLWIDTSIDENTLGDLAFKDESELNFATPSDVTSEFTILLQSIFPIGAVFTSGSATMPSLIASIGEWERVQGRFIVGASDSDSDFDVNDTGGSKTHSHNLSSNGAALMSMATGLVVGKRIASPISSWTATHSISGTFATSSSSFSTAMELGGSTDSASGLPPFKAKYMWERVA